jgi:5-methyltetrahydropteroyltriglutamate--homocysteine methyltransferase
VEARNHALANIDPDQMRMHVCWGNYEGPHDCDVPLPDILDIVLQARPNGLLIEAANPRHAHEWAWEDVKLPDGKVIAPGMIDTTHNYLEHPELIVQRLVAYGRLVGMDNLLAGTDCGLSTAAGAASVVWAKLWALREGADIATGLLKH